MNFPNRNKDQQTLLYYIFNLFMLKKKKQLYPWESKHKKVKHLRVSNAGEGTVNLPHTHTGSDNTNWGLKPPRNRSTTLIENHKMYIPFTC